MLRELSEAEGYGWEILLVNNPDKELIALPDEVVVVSSDSWILDDGGSWCNLGRELLGEGKGLAEWEERRSWRRALPQR
jgi:hypothetical protein